MHEHHDVVIVGAGPAGLAAAATLVGHGIDVLVLDRRPAEPQSPRATVLSMRTMEHLRSWGLEDQIRAGGDEVEMTMLEMGSAATAAHGTAIEVGYPSLAQSSLVSPTSPACVPQDHLERVLRRHLAAQRGVELRFGIDARLQDHGPHGVTLAITDEHTGATGQVTADHLVAADGARSRLRSALGIAMVGQDDLMRGWQAEVHAPLWDVLGPHRHLLYSVTHPEAEIILVPAGGGDRWVIGGTPENLPDLPDRQAAKIVRRLVRRASGVERMPVTVERITRFSAGAHLAEAFSRGRVFLVGDAAHRITPRGGTGLNTAFAGGIDLGWRLAWVHRGWAPDTFLATYEQERRVPATHNLVRSIDSMGSRRSPTSELQVDLGGRVPHAWIGDRQSTLDRVGRGVTLFTSSAAWADAEVAGGIAVDVVQLTPDDARVLGIGPAGALLVRPDGVPVASWWAAEDPSFELARAVAAVIGAPPASLAVPSRNVA